VVTNEADLGPNIYDERKSAWRRQHGYEKSKGWYARQGRQQGGRKKSAPHEEAASQESMI
jgi:hypothetical protein